MKAKFICSALFFASGLTFAQSITLPTVSMRCINPQIFPKFDRVQRTLAVTGTVQVNVGIPAGPGTIWVNDANDAICTGKISNGYRFTSGTARRDETNIAGFSGMTSRAMDQTIMFFPQIYGDEIVFRMYSTSPNIKGTANFKFYVTYELI